MAVVAKPHCRTRPRGSTRRWAPIVNRRWWRSRTSRINSSGLQLLQQQAEAQQRAVDAAQRATFLSDSRYRNGMVSQLDLLDARRSEVRNRRQALQVRAARYQATVGLIRALGGGWGEVAKVADAT